jgi:hypothetical protein
VGLEIAGEHDDLGRRPRDLSRRVDRPAPRRLHVAPRADGLDEVQVGVGIELDQLLRAQPDRLRAIVCLASARPPLLRAQRHLLQERGGDGDHGRGGRSARGGRLDRGQRFEEAPEAHLSHQRRSLLCVAP